MKQIMNNVNRPKVGWPHSTTASQNPKPPPPLRRLRDLPQFGLRQFAIVDDGCEMTAHLTDDVAAGGEWLGARRK